MFIHEFYVKFLNKIVCDLHRKFVIYKRILYISDYSCSWFHFTRSNYISNVTQNIYDGLDADTMD